MTNEKIKIIRKGVYRIITVIQSRQAGGYKLAQDFEKRTYTLEKNKWKDSFGYIWEVVERVEDEPNK